MQTFWSPATKPVTWTEPGSSIILTNNMNQINSGRFLNSRYDYDDKKFFYFTATVLNWKHNCCWWPKNLSDLFTWLKNLSCKFFGTPTTARNFRYEQKIPESGFQWKPAVEKIKFRDKEINIRSNSGKWSLQERMIVLFSDKEICDK